ncbi:tRNA (adenine(22)-N(1))-methyltransferase [Paenibacillus lentus]|uniref:SAM-dependent methyltransferase n=1 Tax=Paenibacillus lentus TaxID=1338368 RepID=A0A3S8RVC5_9BACL|nr:class I SAM-dependent methyltransferase [Paenibacillus lentus]AZK46852.1 SAM-dependent methyltransferase [Paenibacillus lentus]
MKLSSRLQHIADRLPPGCRFADIGSDHALLPVWAVKHEAALSAVAGEVNDGPLKAAKRQVAEAGLGQRIAVRRGDGLQVIDSGEVDTITIAGMGGALIASILEAGQDKLAGVKRLILQPNVGEELVRRWLLDHDWYVTDETILEEDGKIYEIITADAVPDASKLNEELYKERPLQQGKDDAASKLSLTKELLLLLGPRLAAEASDVFLEKWNSEIVKLERIHHSVAASQLSASQDKAQELSLMIKQLKGVLACLPKVRR